MTYSPFAPALRLVALMLLATLSACSLLEPQSASKLSASSQTEVAASDNSKQPMPNAAEAATPPEYADLHFTHSEYQVEFYVHDDLSVRTRSRVAVKALTESAAQRLKAVSFAYSTSLESFEVIEAYTLKADGSRVEVPPGNYQVNVNTGAANAGPAISDMTRFTIIFPDVAQGDTVHYEIEKTEKEAFFPGHFSVSQTFWPQTPYESATLILNTPSALEYQLQVRQLNMQERRQDGRKLVEMRYVNPRPLKDEREDFTVFDIESVPGFAASSFESYAEIARVYAQRALPKAQVTARVSALAKQIVGETKERRQQARLLHEWIAQNMTYAPNSIGIGAIVPRDLDFVLDNRLGDCKDHATLYQALLSALGIRSEQALINANSIYRLPEIPVANVFDHVITYLPEWDHFVDTTDHDRPFEMLGGRTSDKPVMLTNGEAKRTPSTDKTENKAQQEADFTLTREGHLQGMLKVSLQGYSAAGARQTWRHVTPQQEQQYLEQMLSSQNRRGQGNLRKDDPKPLLSTFNYELDFVRPEFIAARGSGAFRIEAPLYSDASIRNIVGTSPKELGDYELACYSAQISERYRYQIADELKILAIPEDFEIHAAHVHYRARYRLENNILHVERMIDDRTPANVCHTSLINQQRKVMSQIQENLDMQVVYQYR